MKQIIISLTVGLNILCFTLPVVALNNSLSEKGIDVLRLQQEPYNLQGRKVSIGQVEIGRPKQFGLDKVSTFYKKLPITRLFYRNQAAQSNNHIDNHAMMVASVMISNQKKFTGIAPRANLYSGAVGSIKNAGQPEECITTNHIAVQKGGTVRAINFSFGESLARDKRENPQLDGNSLLTQCVDWSARIHNVLYVVAGNQGKGGIPIPTDNYNGITTAYSMKKNGIFSKVDFANLSISPLGIAKGLTRQEINVGPRRSISLLAPGNRISVYNVDGKIEQVTGSSFAAPHITASVALLHEAGNNFLRQKSSIFTKDYRQHEVMKAILLNSADKLKDLGDGNLLGMTRTIFTQNNQTWLESDAYNNPEIPLHIQMGTGHLNTMRAYKQLEAGQYNYKEKVPSMGWNYAQIDKNQTHDYFIKQPLKGKSFITITLAWDRLVELNDLNNNQEYDLGENFIDEGLNNLDLELINNNNNNNKKITCSSISKVDSVEHIFCPIPETGEYKIRVKFTTQVNKPIQFYGLAWHGVENRR
ncbi:MAG: S8 family serine peptidase [Cyanobacteria bacterium]|nr:S8 family serine peptidase [Cyanobacteria bacterium CG_2015-16_32_12]NCO78231.1 S8 family serine peptidase [Cyanobacteria bacterium CG_2015-22_32_23]NCQ03272.1 S8 family serine peptidase [Cyanobacteria bacterium CG_2015-09_32_10]NCQ41957.1 S8 family serine peptidase [Cyanobacteria bacterium CG_2015-04_32_10]NCS85705.1 S8 family serine peptidase [Cyanobacteria bacterium CG_2015-02_32_10]